MFRETRLGVKVGSHQECESIEEPTNIRNTNDNATSSLGFFSGLVVFCSVEVAIILQSPYFPICDMSGRVVD